MGIVIADIHLGIRKSQGEVRALLLKTGGYNLDVVCFLLPHAVDSCARSLILSGRIVKG